MAITTREQQMLDLAEGGLDERAIAREMGIKQNSVRRTLSMLSNSPKNDLAREEAIRRGSRALLGALYTAGYPTLARFPERRL